MVINWSIVDLQISGNTHLLQKQIQMKRRFVRIFKLLFISYIFVLPFNGACSTYRIDVIRTT